MNRKQKCDIHYNGILIWKGKENSDTCYNMDEPKVHFAKCKIVKW